MKKLKTGNIIGGLIVTAAPLYLIYCFAAIFNGPTPRPKEYETVSVNQAFYNNKPVQVEGRATYFYFKPNRFLNDADLDFKLIDDAGSEIKCQTSDGIAQKLIPPHKFNKSDEDNIVDAYTALIKNEAKDNLKVTASGRMKGKKLDMYEITVNDTKYILLEK